MDKNRDMLFECSKKVDYILSSSIPVNKKLIVRAYLKSINPCLIFDNIEKLIEVSLRSGTGETLFYIIKDCLIGLDLSSRVDIYLSESDYLMQLINYYDNDQSVLNLLFKDLELKDEKVVSNRRKIIVKYLDLIMPCFESTEFINFLNKIGIKIEDIERDDQFLNHFCAQPLLFSSIVSDSFDKYCANHKKFSGALSLFLYQIFAKRHIAKRAIEKIFDCNNQSKLKVINSVRRYSAILSDIESEVDLIDLSRVFSNKFNFIIYTMLGGRVAGNHLEKYMVGNHLSMSSHEKVFCFSKYGVDAKVVSFLNNFLLRFDLSPIRSANYISINDVFDSINNIVVTGMDNLCQPLISVIVSTHNPEITLLSKSIVSIINQSYGNIEVLVVDDCSNNGDEIQQMVENYKNVQYFRMDENSGPYLCRNLAIQKSVGDYIAFQDDDDVSHPQRIEYQYNVLRNSDAMVSAVSHVRFDRYGQIQFDLKDRVLSDGPVTMLIRRGVFDSIGLFRKVKSRGDVEFRARCIASYGEASYIQDEIPLYYAFGSATTLSSSYEYKQYSKLKFQRYAISLELS